MLDSTPFLTIKSGSYVLWFRDSRLLKVVMTTQLADLRSLSVFLLEPITGAVLDR